MTQVVCEPMSPRSNVSVSFPSRTLWRSTAAWLTLMLSACSPVTSGSTTPDQQVTGLPASSSGLCLAIAALPDITAAERAFTNLAHEPLHGLAADPRLDRSISARILEAMQTVELDFKRSPDMATLTDDLAGLRASADTALQALDVAVPACAG